MPELPEVQTIADDLQRSIRGWKVADFSSLWEKNVLPGMRNFKKNITGAKVESVERKGKFVLIKLGNGNVIVVHLRMTGALMVKYQKSNSKSQMNLGLQSQGSDYCATRHIRHWWELEKDNKKMKLLFSDLRKFGTIDLLVGDETSKHKSLCILGPDPLSKKFTSQRLKSILKRHPKRTARNILLDQCLIAGIGNIYASEIFFEAKISPKKKAGRMNLKEIGRLAKSTRKVLKKAVEMRGTTISDYRDSSGSRGSFQNYLKVYNREHGRCTRSGCNGHVVREKIQQRSAFWCPKCQK